ncbi:hypothetical protein A2348_01075 [Candidatus Uhrbacteria bacterium RIFOXYB12_FULL_58_10]|uniref:Uncharacterized protein n=1 Tax=Candidatus Uhrbacteria bacterium RIFOXYB2_FULL_57_15 TaxID=1802422 RepID=A0A1F7W891_9BACT|nr:MAG: hypothetical protein A2348_01075 [Candidatus Uhrbacteria bacterium RIFOXYB12_FULL_58_10]OGL99012.1 MAG: hypothetical protein A2304_02585 [Candidatus Uhrbacteria bacterium RIFOXYB2_FULL_57_15]OGM00232.1 MAG: hypothetical protein A2501_01720 [Candidatus Uhrbacteria bacterium RIFOXYC12_FULL_57_11]
MQVDSKTAQRTVGLVNRVQVALGEEVSQKNTERLKRLAVYLDESLVGTLEGIMKNQEENLENPNLNRENIVEGWFLALQNREREDLEIRRRLGAIL